MCIFVNIFYEFLIDYPPDIGLLQKLKQAIISANYVLIAIAHSVLW